ncbi:MAG: hypothetical protein WC628_03215 [Candidatus Omnitrophota bacterium]
MSRLKAKALTFLELIIAMLLAAVILLAIHNISFYTNFHVLTADRRAKTQNEAVFCLEHMSKELARAIGNEKINVGQIVDITGDVNISAFIDAYPGDGQRGSADYWIKYSFNRGERNLTYCGNCGADKNCAVCGSSWEKISDKVYDFNANPTDNFISLNITACYDPKEKKFLCGTPDNPTANLTTRIKMPQVSVN